MKMWKKVLGISMSMLLAFTPAVYAAPAVYDVAADASVLEDGTKIYPGDSISGAAAIYLGQDNLDAGVSEEMTDGVWTNESAQVYKAFFQDLSPAYLLKSRGYALWAVNAEITETTPGEEKQLHAFDVDETDWFGETVTPNAAYAAKDVSVTLTADDAPDGMIFTGWSVAYSDGTLVNLADLGLTDDMLETPEPLVYTIVKTDKIPCFCALYEEGDTPEPETDAPETSAPETDAPETNAPETDAPETNAPETDPVVVEEGYTLSVTSNDGSMTVSNSYENLAAGSQMNIRTGMVNEKGEAFAGWMITPDSVTAESLGFSAYSNDITLTMPAQDITLTALYYETETATPETTPTTYMVTVDNGTSDVTYAEGGSTVTITAYDAPENMVFSHWASNSDDVNFADMYASTTTFLMPYSNVTVYPVYIDSTFTVTADSTVTAVTTPIGNNQARPGDGVTVTAAAAPSGQKLSGFKVTTDKDGAEVAMDAVDTASGTGTFTMPASNVTVSAVYETAVYNIYFAEGSTDKLSYYGTTTAGQTITLVAAKVDNATVSGWTVTAADGTAVPVTTVDEQTVTFVMPAQNVTAGVSYAYKTAYTLTVENGTGGGSYYEGTAVTITANAAADGQRFVKWTLAEGSGTIADPASATTTFTMGAANARVTAVYEQSAYTLTVNNGSGSGTYGGHDSVSITANYPSAGKEFDSWSVVSGGATLANAASFYGTLTLNGANAEVTANYKDGPSADSNAITGIDNEGEYLKGTTLSFTAVGAGMDNTAPNPGDYRYRPTGYQISTVSGSWTAAPYSTSMAINAAGDYTLTVTYAKDVYDGSNWVADGTTTTKSLNFHVVNNLSVQTGDTSPIIPLAGTAGGALALIIVLLLLRRRKN